VYSFNRIAFRLKIFTNELAETDIVIDYENTFHWSLD
jgi:hypothetical protein